MAVWWLRSGSFIKGRAGSKGAGTTAVYDMVLLDAQTEAAVLANLETLFANDTIYCEPDPPHPSPPYT